MSQSKATDGLKAALLATSFISLVEVSVRLAAVMVISPLIIRSLGTHHYGLWLLVLSWAGWFEILDLGMSGTAARYFSAAIGRKDEQELSALWIIFKRYYRNVGTAVLAFCLLVVLTEVFFTRVFSDDVLWSFLPLCIGQAVIMRHRVYLALLKGHLLHQIIIKLGISKIIVHSIIVLCLYPQHLSVLNLSLLHLSLVLFEQVAIYLRARKFAPIIRTDFVPSNRVKEIIGFAIKNIIGSASLMFREKFDSQLVASFVNLSSVSQHAVGVRFPNLLIEISNALFGGHLMSGFAKSAAWKNRDEQLHDLMSATRLSSFVALVSGVVLYFNGPSFLLAWLGPDFVQAGTVLQVLMPGVVLSVMQYPIFAILPALNRHGALAVTLFITAIFNFILSIFLVQKIGIVGVVLATSIDMGLQSLLVLPWLISRIFEISAFKYAMVMIARPIFLFSTIVVPLWYCLTSELEIAGYWQIAELSLGLCILASSVAFFTVLNKTERSFLLAKIRQLFVMLK